MAIFYGFALWLNERLATTVGQNVKFSDQLLSDSIETEPTFPS